MGWVTYGSSRLIYYLPLHRKEQEKVVFLGGRGANEMDAPHFGPRVFSTDKTKGCMRVKPVKTVTRHTKIAAIAVNCGELVIFCSSAINCPAFLTLV